MQPNTGKEIITACGYITFVFGVIGLLWGFIFSIYGNRLRLIFKGWLRILYWLFFFFFFVGSILVFTGAIYYFTTWYVLNPDANVKWSPSSGFYKYYNIEDNFTNSLNKSEFIK